MITTDHYDEKWEIHFVGADSDDEMREFVTEVSRDVHARCQVGSKFVDADTDHPDCLPR